ncbi:hypothetical protein TRFO_25131 [Tritrichomonas foetus]|uniref:Uncharacterized protein n=1 Tax=Tritrichomonas foetus TaxID=1144522 RepID=A0A1J4KAT4_9EUKA|nr:hypothetical protein TRFO_25131 [Tritrichomonas foetus]|eukprot:OHT06820.1 hypothetical protein TRFO_25131 [Tritrichomonas foetus]
MQTDLDITRYNTCKKLSQLNKVIQYLSYHLQERVYQVETLKSKYESREKEIVASIDEKIKPLFEGMNEDRIDLENKIKNLYENKISTMSAALEARKSASQDEIKSKIKEIKKEINHGLKTINIINNSLNEQFQFLNDKSKCDVSAVRIRIIQMKKDHQLAIKKHDAESNKKIKAFEDEFSKKVKEMESKHNEEVKLLKSQSLTPSFTPNLSKQLTNQKNQIKTLKNFLQEEKKEIGKQKIIFTQNITAFKARLKALIDSFSNNDNNVKDEIKKMKKLNGEEYKKLKKIILDLRSELDLKRNELYNEITLLNNQIKMKRGEWKCARQQKERELGQTSSHFDREINSFRGKLKDKIDELLKEQKGDKTRHKELIKNIQNRIHNFDSENEISRMNEQKNNNKKDQEHEIERFKVDFEIMVAMEIKRFKETKNKLEEEIRNFNETASEMMKSEAEYKKFKAILESQKRSHIAKIQNFQLVSDEEYNELNTDFTTNDEKFKKTLESNFDVANQKYQADLDDLRNSLDLEYDKRKKELEEQYNKAMSSIVENKDSLYINNYNEKNLKLQQDFNSLESELDSIKVPNNLVEITDESIEELSNKLKKLPIETSNEKNDLLQKYNQAIDEEEERHRQLLMAYLSQQNEVFDFEPIQKEGRDKIDRMEKYILELQEKLKYLESISPTLNIFGDSTDLEKIRLEEELQKLRQELKIKIRKAEAIKSEAIKEASLKIDAQKLENDKLIKEEEDKQKLDAIKSHNDYEEQRNIRKSLSNSCDLRINSEIEHFKETFEQSKLTHTQSMSSLEQVIQGMSVQNEDDWKKYKQVFDNERNRLDNEKDKMAVELPQQLKSLHDGIPNMHPHLDKRIQDAMKRRDNAIETLKNKPMRPEEMSIIQRLEGQLSITTQQLTTVGKDLILYRQQLIHQEGEYNNRFGVDPSVAVMKPTKKRPTTTFAPKRLPRLSNSNNYK